MIPRTEEDKARYVLKAFELRKASVGSKVRTYDFREISAELGIYADELMDGMPRGIAAGWFEIDQRDQAVLVLTEAGFAEMVSERIKNLEPVIEVK